MRKKTIEVYEYQLADARNQAVEQGQRADAEAKQAIEWERWADRLAVVAEKRRVRIMELEGGGLDTMCDRIARLASVHQFDRIAVSRLFCAPRKLTFFYAEEVGGL